MAIDEKTRFELRNWFATQMDDPDLADAVMQAMPPVDYDQFATKSDLNDLGAELKSEMSALRVDMAELRTELKGDMAELRTEFKGDIGRLETNIADMRVELTQAITAGQMTSLKWSAAMQLTTIASLGGLLAYLL